MLESNWTLVLAAIVTIVALFYRYVKQKQNYWSRQNLDGPKSFLIFGNIERLFKSPEKYEIKWRQKYGQVFGYNLGMTQVLSISDPELIKQVMIKDFQHFVNRRPLKVKHEIMTEHLFLLEGERWKRVRSIVSPTFTAGKLRGMQSMMNRCVLKLDNYFGNITASGNKSTINTKEVLSGLTIDVIASTTFATETNANDERKQKNPFVTQALKFFETSPIRMAAILLFPKSVNDLLGIHYLANEQSAEFFMNLSSNIVNQRKQQKSGSKRNDLVDLLLEASVDNKELDKAGYDKLAASMDDDKSPEPIDETPKSSSTSTVLRKLTEKEVVAQCIVFFAAGFETTASTISHILFELARNPECQQRLFEELTGEKLDPNSENFFDSIMTKFPYMDAVIKETLRRYPPLQRLERRVGVDGYRLGNVELRKGQVVEIATYIVHHDPEYFPDPYQFNPERFMPENKHLLVPYSYVPFGIGPRNCVGMRFAYQEIKMFLANIIPKYRFEVTPNTPQKLQFKKASFLFSSFPFELNVSKR